MAKATARSRSAATVPDAICVMSAIWDRYCGYVDLEASVSDGGFRDIIVACGFGKPFDEFRDVGFLDDQRRQKPNDIVAGRDGQQAAFTQIVYEGTAVGLHLDAEHEADTAHRFEQMIVIGNKLLEGAAQRGARL